VAARTGIRTRKARRKLDEKCRGAGDWIIEGYHVYRAPGAGSVKRWLIDDPGGNRVGQPGTLGQAREMIRNLLGELGVWEVAYALTIYSVVGGTFVFFLWLGFFGLLTSQGRCVYAERRETRRLRRQVMRCRRIRAMSAMLEEACPDDHGSGNVVLVVEHKPASVRLDIFGGLLSYTRDSS
jgi:hypothetical protein